MNRRRRPQRPNNALLDYILDTYDSAAGTSFDRIVCGETWDWSDRFVPAAWIR